MEKIRWSDLFTTEGREAVRADYSCSKAKQQRIAGQRWKMVVFFNDKHYINSIIGRIITEQLGLEGPAPHSTLNLASLNLIKLTRAHFSTLSRSIRMGFLPSVVSTIPPSLASSANYLLRVHSTSEFSPRAFQVLRLLDISSMLLW